MVQFQHVMDTGCRKKFKESHAINDVEYIRFQIYAIENRTVWLDGNGTQTLDIHKLLCILCLSHFIYWMFDVYLKMINDIKLFGIQRHHFTHMIQRLK